MVEENKTETPTADETPSEKPHIEEKPAEEPEPEEKPQIRKPEKKIRPERGESYWSPKELANKLACGSAYVYRMIDEGKIKATRQGRIIRISPEEAKKVIEKGLPLPPKPAPKIEAEEVVIDDERIIKKMEPPKEPKEDPDKKTGKPGWPLSILFK